MNCFPEYIRLDNTPIAVKKLIHNRTPETVRESEFIVFLKEWYSNEKFIEVKTSGSTGTPKTIRLKKEFVAESAQRTLHFFQLKNNDCVLHCLPLKYIAGKLMIVRALLGELDLHLIEPSTDFSILKTKKFRFAAVVPNQVIKILNAGATPGELMGHIEQLLIGGSALPASLEKELLQFSTTCFSSYGMTETATHIALRKISRESSGGWYQCLENINVNLSVEGCLQIFMPGLPKQPLKTTDLAELKDEKTFRILGRSDNVIISGGIKFSPEQIEKKLEPFISEPFLISFLPHESLGKQLVLVLEEKEPEEANNRILKICRQFLDKYEQPRKIIFVSKIPKTSNGKFIRANLQL
jgi:O-succinylbenzoic acid--CoA ligase